MRALTLIVLACLASSCAHQPGRKGSVERAEVVSPSVHVEYRKPMDPAHEPIYVEMRDRKVLEHVAEAIAVLRLPKALTLSFTGCDGTSNAFYREDDISIVFCYEYVADIEQAADTAMKAVGGSVTADAIDGPIVFVLFHETAHAVFHLLEIPVLGKEEDAADSFAAMSLLRMGDEMALRMLKGAAWAYQMHGPPDLDASDFSDVHSLDEQRYYNILCLAYGSDKKYFSSAVTSGMLPQDRAEGCRAEFQQVQFAMQKLIMPSIDARRLERFLMKHSMK
jgi:Putative metallopeptidase